jgi:hypothetical protein
MKETWRTPHLTVHGDVQRLTQENQTPCVLTGGTKSPDFSDTLNMGQSQNAAGCS